MHFIHAKCLFVGVDFDSEYSEEDEKERRQLIEQVFELQNTLDGIQSTSVDLALFAHTVNAFAISMTIKMFG